MNGVPMAAYLLLGLVLFTIGVVGVVIRRSPIVIFMCIELMLNAVNLTTLAFARYLPQFVAGRERGHTAVAGEMIVIFIMAVAAAEVAVGLGIIMAIFRLRDSTDIDQMNVLRG
ncbi:MAG TPA: NADH-quinone oxidoreductase subunit NuoK [Fimbriimonadaceae bacterium]|nr:NADH-quinone oxidoreductase subunit NuoK [Fimbriimonadaceae bacterium]